MTPGTERELAVHRAVASVDDPEYPGISIVDLGLLESIDVRPGSGAGSCTVSIGLVPTFSGCPALAMIATDVQEAVAAVEGVESVEVEWLRSPQWSIDRVSADARRVMAERFTVAVQIGSDPPPCPRCGAPTVEHSMFGPSRCRAVNRCESCSEMVEVMRG
jgi:ring-1,2-phenylacetyl-CoA epoxidase subunit PaaD